MSLETLITTLTSFYATNVEESLSIPTTYDNAPVKNVRKDVWARFSILTGDSFQRQMGSGKFRRTPGIVMIQLFIDRNQGTGKLFRTADQILPFFTHANVGGVKFLTGSVANIGDDKSHYQLNLSCPFFYDDEL